MSDYDGYFDLLRKSKKTVALTGAGISTLSNIRDFRSSTGLYNDKYGNIPVEKLLDKEFFLSHPELFYSWARNEWYKDTEYEPSIVHKALFRMEDKGLLNEGIYTQNIDSLHEKAGSVKVYELHGSLRTSSCVLCGRKYSFDETRKRIKDSSVPKCDCGGLLKCDIVFYSENLDEKIINMAYKTFSSAELCIVLGTSLTVNPASSLPYLTLRNGGNVVICNRDKTYIDDEASFVFRDLKEWGEKTYKYLLSC